ncbi:MAG: hydantoinase B/oxoprolinase family protein [Polyangiaceae bacterium]|nr:hydantoinase B/oxoprolinase family protein [Polyangiaceae bacterium]
MGTVDPITVEVLRGAMETVAFEMATHVSLAAVTPILNQSNERNASIIDSKGRLAALSVGIPQFMLASRGPVRFALEFYDESEFREGDIFVGNDPYHGGGHLPDWNVFAPVIVDGKLLLIASIQCHHGDTGGQTPGGYCVDAIDVWAEGLRVPTMKIMEEGKERKDVMYMLQANNRLPAHTADVRAQMGAAMLGAKRLKALAEEYGSETIQAAVDYSIDLTTRKVKESIKEWPDGVYEGQAFVHQDTVGNRDIKVHCVATIKGDDLSFDFSGSDRRQNLSTNGTIGNTEGMILSQFCTMIEPSIPKNEGLFQSFEMIIPKGTCINPEDNRPVSAGTHHPGVEVSEAICLALSQAIPERAQAQTYKVAIPVVIYGSHPETQEFFVDHSVDTTSNCASASAKADGWGSTPTAFGNLVLATSEINESLLPHRQLGREMMIDTGGAGRYRGQPGSRYIKEVTAMCQVYTWVLGEKACAPGLAGGCDGSTNRLFLRVGSDAEYEVKHTAFYVAHQPGEKIMVEFASGAGWGDAYDRPPEEVVEDVLDELVSVEGAKKDYGVVVTGDLEALKMSYDKEGTIKLREQMRKERAERGPEDAPFDWNATSVADYFARVLPEKLGPDATMAGDFRGIFAYDISGEQSAQFTITIGEGEWSISDGVSDKAVFSISMADTDFLKLMNSEITGQDAFMEGKLKFDGDVSQAMKLQSLFF